MGKILGSRWLWGGLFLTLNFVLILGCGNTKISGNRVKVLVDDGSGQYTFKSVDLKYVRDIQKMKDSALEVSLGGTWDTDGEGVDFSPGTSPSARFMVSDGVLVAQDYSTLLMSTLLYHFENLMERAITTGLASGSDFPKQAHVQVRDKSYDDFGFEDNAAFFSDFNSFIFWSGTMQDIVPVAINSGIVAHEYFHSAFHKLTPNITKEMIASLYSQDLKTEWTKAKARGDDSREYFSNDCRYYNAKVQISKENTKEIFFANQYIIGALNEGLADFFGYDHTRNPDWILNSFKSGQIRALSVAKELNCSDTQSEGWLFEIGKRLAQKKSGAHYSLSIPDFHNYGAFWTQFLYEVIKLSNRDDSHERILAQIAKFISALDQDFEKNGKKKIYTWAVLVELFNKVDLGAQRGDLEAQALGRAWTESQCKAGVKVFPNSGGIKNDVCGDKK